jgi:hypothetical protein
MLLLSAFWQQKYDTLERLSGTWSGKAGADDYSEHWEKSADGYSGSAETRKEGKLIFSEKVSILTHSGRIVYRVSAGTQQPVDFVLEKMRPDTLWFSNLKHDYPKHIVYAFKGDSIIACISGEPYGQKSFTFRLKKTQ